MKAKHYMAQRLTIIITTIILLAGIIGFGVYHNTQVRPRRTAANAIVTTGVSLSFGRPLSADATASFTDSTHKQVLKQKLEAHASRFNIPLKPGVYQLTITSKDAAQLGPDTISVSQGQVNQVAVSLGTD
jgi:hypothetical protein